MNNCSNIQIQEAILKTLSYFDIFGYPLTIEEIRRLLWFPCNLSNEDFVVNLQTLLDSKQIDYEHSFYFLKVALNHGASKLFLSFLFWLTVKLPKILTVLWEIAGE